MSPRTRKLYAADVRRFRAWCAEHRTRSVAEYVYAMVGAGYRMSTIQRAVCAIWSSDESLRGDQAIENALAHARRVLGRPPPRHSKRSALIDIERVLKGEETPRTRKTNGHHHIKRLELFGSSSISTWDRRRRANIKQGMNRAVEAGWKPGRGSRKPCP